MRETEDLDSADAKDAMNAGFAADPAAWRGVAGGEAEPFPVRVEQVDAARWDELAVTFADVRQEQTSVFNLAKWGADRIEHLLVRRGGDILGGGVVLVVKAPLVRSGLALVKWGPLWRPLAGPAEPGRLHTLLAALTRHYAHERGLMLALAPQPDPEFGAVAIAMLEALGFTAGPVCDHPARYLVNVDLTPEALRESLGQKWRYNLKKSAANALRIEIDETDGALDRFMALYDRMLARKGFYDTSAIATLPALMRCGVGAIRPMVVVADHAGSPMAGAVIDVSGDQAVYLYGATDERALGLNAGYAMHWRIAEWLCARPRIRWYDLGGNDGDAGLHQFKKGFAGKQGTIIDTPPYYLFGASPIANAFGRSIFALRGIRSIAERAAHRLRRGVRP